MKFLALLIVYLTLSNDSFYISAKESNLKADSKHDHFHEGLPHYTWFLDQIFALYSDKQNETTITQNDFKDIVKKLNIDYHDHDEHDHDHNDHNDHDHIRSFSKSKSDNFSLVNLLLKKKKIFYKIFSSVTLVIKFFTFFICIPPKN